MSAFTRHFFSFLAATALAQAMPALAGDTDLDALSLESAPEAALPQSNRNTRIFLEGAVGDASQRYQPNSRDIWRASLDFSLSAKLAPGLRATLSDRLDHLYPTDAGADANVNSLREAYLSWQTDGGNSIVELGRINLRYGPGYGYNPTDFFRDGSLRTLTTANPFALRENRLGTVMLRGQRLWTGGSLSIALSPKMANQPNADGWSLDLGSTNNRDRALVALNTQFSQSVSSQVLVYKEPDVSATFGASLTALLSDAAVAHLEVSRGSEPDLLSRALATPSTPITRNRFAGGLTYTTTSKLSLTAEYQYNGFAIEPSNWAALGPYQVAYLLQTQQRQDLAARQAYFLYITQKSLGHKDIDLTAFLKVNAEDHSILGWLELRRHWPSFDLALQLQQHMGEASSEFGILPQRRVIQVLGTFFF